MKYSPNGTEVIYLSFCSHDLHLSDSAKISVSDLENIQETETPPQSPTGIEEVKIDMAGHAEETTILYTKRHEEEIKRRESEGLAAVQEHGATPTRYQKKGHKSPRKLVHYQESETEAGEKSADHEVINQDPI